MDELVACLRVNVTRDEHGSYGVSVWDSVRERGATATGELRPCPYHGTDVAFMAVAKRTLETAVERALRPSVAYGKQVTKRGTFHSRIGTRP